LDELTASAETLLKEADKSKDGKLDEEELGTGVALLMPGARRPGGPEALAGRENSEPAARPRLTPTDVKAYPDAGLYEPTVLRTFFLEFENKDWEAELVDFTGPTWRCRRR
jgi:hypothetical protein